MGKSVLDKVADVATLGTYGAVTGKGAFEKPKAPDFEGAAQLTADENRKLMEEQTRANRPDQFNPWGSVTWQQDADGKWAQHTALNDSSQQAFDSQQALQLGRSQLGEGMMGRMQNEFGGPMQWGDFGEQQGLEFDPSEVRQKAEDAAYGRATSRLDPRFAQESNALEIKMRNQGLSPGDEAWDKQMGNFSRGKEDAYSNAQNMAVTQGRGEASQMWNQQKGEADYANQLRENSQQEEMRKRGFSLNEMNSIMSGQQVNLPGFTPFNQAGRAPGTDHMGAMTAGSNFDQAAQQSQNQLYGNALMAAGMFCDRRLKRNIKRIGKYLGYPFYAFEYVWGELAFGVMADEVNHEAVTRHISGYDVVHYNKLIPIEE